MLKIITKDLKTKVNEDDFYSIQEVCFSKNVGWDISGLITKNYSEDYNFMYYRAKSSTLQYGIREENFELDNAEEVRAEEFIKMINDVKNNS